MKTVSLPSHFPIWGLLAVLGWGWAASAKEPEVVIVSPPPHQSGPVLFVANGAGDFRGASKAIGRAIHEAHLPIQLVTFVWTHGYGRVIQDVCDQDNVIFQGRRLAQWVVVQQRACPHQPIYLLGHCAGCAIVLEAAKHLPPCCVERVLLLAPSVSKHHDLSAVLRCARRSVEVFHSKRDWLSLGLLMRCLSPWGPKAVPCAGRFGFCPSATHDAGHELTKLRQHPWQPTLKCTGWDGGHFTIYKQGYLRHFILDLVTEGDPIHSASPD
ncbi:MAG: hypothetical protein ACK4RK_07575 [Gemmataceae bacterium]